MGGCVTLYDKALDVGVTIIETRRTVTLPWPPSTNRAWRVFRGRLIVSKVGRDYQKAVSNALSAGRCVKPLHGRLLVWLSLHPPLTMGRRKWDVANREKIMIDTLTKQRVWLDDSQIDMMIIERATPLDSGRVVVTIHEQMVKTCK